MDVDDDQDSFTRSYGYEVAPLAVAQRVAIAPSGNRFFTNKDGGSASIYIVQQECTKHLELYLNSF